MQVLDLIHSLEVVNSLMADGARQLTDWAWSKQLRYYSAGLVLGDSGSMPGRASLNRKQSLADGRAWCQYLVLPSTDRCKL